MSPGQSPSPSDSLGEALLSAVFSNDMAAASRLLDLGADPAYRYSLPLAQAAASGNIELMERLLPLSDPAARDCRAARWASANGQTQALKLLLSASFVAPSCALEALERSAGQGHADCVELLIPLCPLCPLAGALIAAAEQGHASCVALLLPFCDPTFQNNLALSQAAAFGREPCVRLLMPSANAAPQHEALALAAESGHELCVLILMENASDEACSNALLRACRQNQLRCAELILSERPPSLERARAIQCDAELRERQASVALMLSYIETLELASASASEPQSPVCARLRPSRSSL